MHAGHAAIILRSPAAPLQKAAAVLPRHRHSHTEKHNNLQVIVMCRFSLQNAADALFMQLSAIQIYIYNSFFKAALQILLSFYTIFIILKIRQ